MDNLSPRPGDDRPKRRRWPFRLTLLLLAIGMAWGVYAWYRHRSTKPVAAPLPRTTRFLNVRLGVAYVGSQRCGECHVAESDTYAAHPMGRSVRPAGRELTAQRKAVRSFDASGLHYAVERRGETMWHRVSLPTGDAKSPVELVGETSYAIGSGRQGQSFLLNRDGRLYQSPISWFVRAKAWNLSPGFEQNNQHFSRTITEECLFCHCNEARVRADTINHFEPKSMHLEPIGCERCHGPGELHVATHENGDIGDGVDRTIVNPRRLTPQLREAVCEQCHLQGEARIVHEGASLWDFRPGLPLDQFVSVFVPPPTGAGSRKAVSHVEQMHQSRCFQSGNGKMGCISCHDPHVLPSEDERVSWYRGRCLNCHAENSCSLTLDERHEQSAADSCIDCHMPRGDSSNIAHTSITDHRIVRRAAADGANESGADFRLVRFHSGMWDQSDNEARRDLGLALVALAENTNVESGRRTMAHRALPLLMPAVERHSTDVAAWEGLGQALWRDKRPREALSCLEKTLQLAPRRELTLQTAALVSLDRNEADRSIAYWDRLLEVNPYTWQGHAFRGQALALKKQWGEAIVSCDAALRLNPFDPRTRMLHIDCLIRQGQRKRARDELKALLALRPVEPEVIQKWFDEQMKTAR